MTNTLVSGRFRKTILRALAPAMLAAVGLPAMGLPSDTGTWGLGLSARLGSIPYDTDMANTVGTAIPQIFYEGEHFYLRSKDWGLKLYDQGDNQINAIIKRRYVNIPEKIQNDYQEDALDRGLQWIHRVNDKRSWRLEALTESNSRSQLFVGHDWQLRYGGLELNPTAGLRYKSKNYNNYYYGLNAENIGVGVEAEIGVDFRYPLLSGWYIIGGLEYIHLDSNARNSRAVRDNGYGAVRLGFAYFEGSNTNTPAFAEGAYIRVAHGWATPSNMNQILRLDYEKDPYNNQLTSVLYGHPLVKGWLLPAIDVYFTGGFAYHYENNQKDEDGNKVQDRALETIMALKAYYNFTWPVRWRLGVAEGMSYISEVSYIEQSEMDRKNYEGSKLMNYLDFTIDVNLGDVFRSKSIDRLWAGYSMHHRSAIFQKSSQFGRIKGGSNYNTMYLQWHF